MRDCAAVTGELATTVVVRDTDHAGQVLALSDDGRWHRRAEAEGDRWVGVGQVRPDGTASAVYAGADVLLRHGPAVWALEDVQVEVAHVDRLRRIARLVGRSGDTVALIEYTLHADHAWQRAVDPAWDGLDEELNDLFVFLEYTNTPEWRSNALALWRRGVPTSRPLE